MGSSFLSALRSGSAAGAMAAATVRAAAAGVVLAGTIGGTMIGGTAAMAQSAAPAEGNDIVVTAQKRSETIQTVPLSMTVVTQNDLEKRGVQSL